MVLPVVGVALVGISVGLLACLVVAIVSPGDQSELAFALPGGVALVLGAGALLRSRRGIDIDLLRPRDGFLAVTLAWLAVAVLGALPYLLQGTFDRPVSAFFESMSGFTTTGATLLQDIEAEPTGILLWRSMTQWLGGVGIVVLVVAVAPVTGLATQRVFYAEVSGFTTERLTPRIAGTAKIIVAIYLGLTAVGLVAYLGTGMGLFDAVSHTMTTVATGGYSTRNASLAAFDSLAVEITAIVLMAVAGVNFAFYWRALRGDRSLFPQLAEVRAYLGILAGSIALVSVSLWGFGDVEGLGRNIRAAAFTVVSITTTTGYTTTDFDAWNDFSRTGLLVLMFVGGCAGCTAGGIKVIRVMLLAKAAAQEVRRGVQPSAVQVLRMPGRVFPEEMRRGLLGFVAVYLLVAAVATLAMTAVGLDMVSAASSVAATLNVIGPGLGEVGAAENYAGVPQSGLWLLSACMLLGRLEIFTVLALLVPAALSFRRQRRPEA